MLQLTYLWVLAAFFAGAAVSALALKLRLGSFEKMASDILSQAQNEARELEEKKHLELQERQIEAQKERERLWQQEKRKLRAEEEELEAREKKVADLEKREAILNHKKELLEEEKTRASQLKEAFQSALERVSGLSSEEAKQELLGRVEADISRHAALMTRRRMKEAEEGADVEAARILSTAMNRIASTIVSETAVTTVSIPNDELKGRIIGREGRNIRTLERLTGVNFVVDDTPGAVLLSCFDPIRREIAKIALNDLLSDGRIHPTRIEEAVEKAGEKVQKEILAKGENAALRVGALGLHPEIIKLLGKLSFRYSYGQNILEHSLEVAHLMGLLASELGLNVNLAKRIGLLHDMGKALSHELQGTHAIVGHDFALKFGEKKEVANGIGCHHNEMKPLTLEGSLCSTADTLSASRPGARVEAIEEYVKRMRHLEELAYEFPGIDKAYVLQAGKELRVIVIPTMIDDDGLINLARDLTKRIESALDYPGNIKITAIREMQAVQYAL